MGHYYFDSSALAKRYIAETGTNWINSLWPTDLGHTFYTVRISGAEIVAALFRRVRSGTLDLTDAQTATTQFKTEFRNRYQIVEVTESLVDEAMTLSEQYDLRGYDSVQLAAALALQTVRASLSLSNIIFVCADNKLNTIASIEGLSVENPNIH